MKEITIPLWDETFKVKQGLTKKLDLPEWVIFYDKKSGLWAYNINTTWGIWLNSKLVTLNHPLIDNIIEYWRDYIRRRETEKRNSEATKN